MSRRSALLLLVLIVAIGALWTALREEWVRVPPRWNPLAVFDVNEPPNLLTPESAFLHEVRDAACRFFDGVLSPGYNAAHHDHLHLDRGPYRMCR